MKNDTGDYKIKAMIDSNEMNQLAEQAVTFKHNGRNCCQSVIEALTLGDSQIEQHKELLKNLASGFRTGMGGMEGTCGALCGAVMVAGMRIGGPSAGSYAKVIHEDFTEHSGASICKVLKSKKPDGSFLCDCDTCIRNAIYAYGKAIQSNNK